MNVDAKSGKFSIMLKEDEQDKDLEFSEKRKKCKRILDLHMHVDDYANRGLYKQQIDFVLKHFPAEQLYIMISEEVQNNREIEMNKLYSFLGVDGVQSNNNHSFIDKSPFYTRKGIDYKNEGLLPENDKEIKLELCEFYVNSNEQLYELMRVSYPNVQAVWEEK